METKTENPAADLKETEESTDSETSTEEKQRASTDDTGAEEKDTGKSDLKEDQESVETEETIEKRVNGIASRLAKSMTDKAMQKSESRIKELETKLSDTTAQLNDKTWNTGINALFEEESEKDGEEKANKKKAAREEIKKQVVDYQQNKAYVDKMKPELEKRESILNLVQRDQKAMLEVHKLLFADDKAKIDQIQTYLKRFEKVYDEEDMQIMLDTIKAELKAKSAKKQTFDSGKQGGGGLDLSKLSARELLELGEKRRTAK